MINKNSETRGALGTVNPSQHYERAEQLLQEAAQVPDPGSARVVDLLQAARVHATLATAPAPPAEDPTRGGVPSRPGY